jgi:hypothetical protein
MENAGAENPPVQTREKNVAGDLPKASRKSENRIKADSNERGRAG